MFSALKCLFSSISAQVYAFGSTPLPLHVTLVLYEFLYSRISPGWHSNALQIDINVEKRMALALPFLRIERLAIVIPTFSASSVTLIFRFASMTSMFIIIAILVP